MGWSWRDTTAVVRAKVRGLLERIPPPRPGEWWMWLYWMAAAGAAVKLGYDRWPWFPSSSPTTTGRERPELPSSSPAADVDRPDDSRGK